jgi:hypothetical protein
MSGAARPGPAIRLPTLTEVVEVVEGWPAPPSPMTDAALDEAQLTARILASLQQKIDLMLEYRLRELLAPTLARAADLVIREARDELATTLRDLVERAVAQELARRHPR